MIITIRSLRFDHGAQLETQHSLPAELAEGVTSIKIWIDFLNACKETSEPFVGALEYVRFPPSSLNQDISWAEVTSHTERPQISWVNRYPPN